MGKLKEALWEEIALTFYDGYSRITNYNRIIMPRRGRYQVWQGLNKVADHIKHRREALAVMKLLMENDDGNG
jgi:hypothetical protein